MSVLDNLQSAGSNAVNAIKGSDTLQAMLAGGGAGALAGGLFTAGGEKRPDETPGQYRMRILRNSLAAGGLTAGAIGLGSEGYKHLAHALPTGDVDPVAEQAYSITHGWAPRVGAAGLASLYPLHQAGVEQATAQGKLSKILSDNGVRAELNKVHPGLNPDAFDAATLLQHPEYGAAARQAISGKLGGTAGLSESGLASVLRDAGISTASAGSFFGKIPGLNRVMQSADIGAHNLFAGESGLKGVVKGLPRPLRGAALVASLFAPELIGKGLNAIGGAASSAINGGTPPAVPPTYPTV